MRWIMTVGLVALAALAAGCQVVGYAGNPNFDNPFVNDTISPTTPPFPAVFYFPDDTMFFFPIYGDGRPRSDLDLLGLRCLSDGGGHLLVSAFIENQGPSPITPNWFSVGSPGAVRVAAVVTTRDGARERVDGTSMQPVTVAGIVNLAMAPTQVQATDVVRIDMIADPDRVVPDPLRDNNVLSWQGTMQPGAVQCTVDR
jgi:hypothetical protein